MAETVAFIPVRGGSKSIPLKNIKPLCGRPLVYWVTAAAAQCSHIDKVFVATDSSEIRKTVEDFALEKVSAISRSDESASDTATTESAMLEFAQSYSFENIVLIQATSPLLSTDDLNRGFDEFYKQNVDSVLSVVEDKRFYWRQTEGQAAKEVNYDVYSRPRRQDFDGWYMENGAFYITTRSQLLESKNRVSGNIGLCEMPAETAYEIDEPEDWVIIEHLLARRLAQQKPAPDFSKVKMLLTDCDGCLTDAGMYYSESGEELKKFNTRDGMAFALLRERGIKVGIVTGENSQAAKRRGDKLKADHIVINCKDKLAAVQEICAVEGIALSEVAYIGDDLNDLELLGKVGYSCCPADACKQAQDIAIYVAKAKGGQGVIREVAELIL